MSRRKAHFNDLPVETVTNVVQLLIDWRSSSEDAFPYVPPSFPSKGFLSPIASLSRVNKMLRAICMPYLFSCLSCHTLKQLSQVLDPSAFISAALAGSGLEYVKTLSISMRHYSVDFTKSEWEEKRRYDTIIGKQVACIPGMFGSLHCLRLYNVPNLDEFFNALRSTHCLRVLDFLICDSVLGAENCDWGDYEDIPTFREKIMKNIPPLETLRVKFAFGYEDRFSFQMNRMKIIRYIMALIRATESTLLDLSVAANTDMSVGLLKPLRFSRLRRLALRYWPGKPSKIHKFILAHSSHLEEVNVTYRNASPEAHVTLSSIFRIIQGVSPREGGSKDSATIAEDAVDSLVHLEDGVWGHYKCESFGYAKRFGEVVELSISLPAIDIDGVEIDANKNLGIAELADFLTRYEQLEVLTLMVGGHNERSFSEIMGVLGGLCRRSLRKLHSMDLFVELQRLKWGAGAYPFSRIKVPGDEVWGDFDYEFFGHEDDWDFSCEPRLNAEERGERWKKFEEEYYPTAHEIMSSFLKRASSVKQIVWHFWYPDEGRPSSCWTWRRAKTKVWKGGPENKSANKPKLSRGGQLEVGAGMEPLSVVVDDLRVRGAFRVPDRFTFSVGREAKYLKTFNFRS